MKTDFRIVALLSSGLLSLVLCAGCGQQRATADEIPVSAPPPPLLIAAAAGQTEARPTETKPGATPSSPAAPAESKPSDAASESGAPIAASAKPDTNALEAAVMPETLQVTPALAEVIKLVQAGVGEDVLMAYITNSADVFSIGSNEILYLHDLGAPPTVITTLIQTDIVLKQKAGTAKPLPPGVALTNPATNIFSPKLPVQPVEAAQAPAPETPGVETVATTAPEPPVTEGEPPVVYAPPVPAQPVNVSYFYTELAPYGSWVDVPGHGYCWRPTVAVWNSAWRPYADGGRWLWTDHGWYWYSDYSWGWAPFHYGRWSCPPGVGWVWTPDTHWGPAWVSWRYTRNHCGWAPLPPAARFVAGHGFYHDSLSVGISFDFGLSDHHYLFVPTSRFCDRRPINHRLTARHAHSVFKESTVVNNYIAVNNTKIINEGVGIERVASATRGNIRRVALKDTTEVRGTTTRRETLAADGTTLTVARPPSSVPEARPTARGGSAGTTFRPGTQRSVRSTPTVATPSSSLVSGSPNTVGSDRIRPGRRTETSIPDQPSRPQSYSVTVPPATAAGRFQRPNIVPTSRSALRTEAAVPSSSSSVVEPSANTGTGRSGRSAGIVVPPVTTRGPVAAAPSSTSRPQAAIRQPQPARQFAPAPAPTKPLTPNVSQPQSVAPRPQPRQTYVAPVSPRGPVARAPEPVQPRNIAPQQTRRQSPAPAPAPRQYTPPPARSESVRPSNPAPAQRYTPPARSSGGGAAPARPTRSSSGNNGGGRNSR